MKKKQIVISAINFFEGGPLSILKDCLTFLNNSEYTSHYNFIALVHKKSLFFESDFINIKFIEFPKSRTSYIYRLYYEYIYFKSFAKQQNVFFWLSLHDITPRLGNVNQAVYCHNPSPFNELNFGDIYIQPTQFFFRLFYKYLYKINIENNKFVIVQQLWIKHKFEKMFHLDGNKIITAPPEIPQIKNIFLEKSRNRNQYKVSSKTMFFFPTFPRPFKNIEVICEAIKLMSKQKKQNVEVVITIDGSENKYSKSIIQKYHHLEGLTFIGLIEREDVYEYYAKCDCLIFPSKLETWGLPISEFKQFKKPMFVSNLPYAKETVGNYKYVSFFNSENAVQLSDLISNATEGKFKFDKTDVIPRESPFVSSWGELFITLLK